MQKTWAAVIILIICIGLAMRLPKSVPPNVKIYAIGIMAVVIAFIIAVAAIRNRLKHRPKKPKGNRDVNLKVLDGGLKEPRPLKRMDRDNKRSSDQGRR